MVFFLKKNLQLYGNQSEKKEKKKSTHATGRDFHSSGVPNPDPNMVTVVGAFLETTLGATAVTVGLS